MFSYRVHADQDRTDIDSCNRNACKPYCDPLNSMFKPTALYKVLFVCAALEALYVLTFSMAATNSLSDADLLLPFWALTVCCSYLLFRDWKVSLQLTVAVIGCSLLLYNVLLPAQRRVLTDVVAFLRWLLILAASAYEIYFVVKVIARFRTELSKRKTVPEVLESGFSQQFAGMEIPNLLKIFLVSELTGVWTIWILLGLCKDHDRAVLDSTCELNPGVSRRVFSVVYAVLVLATVWIFSRFGLTFAVLFIVLSSYLWAQAFAHCERIRRYGLSRAGDYLKVSMGLLGYATAPLSGARIDTETSEVGYVIGFNRPNLRIRLEAPITIWGNPVWDIGLCAAHPARITALMPTKTARDR